MEMLGSAVGAEFCFGHDLAEFYYGFSFYVAAVTACKIPFVFYVFAAIRTVTCIFVGRNFCMGAFFFSLKKHV